MYLMLNEPSEPQHEKNKVILHEKRKMNNRIHTANINDITLLIE